MSFSTEQRKLFKIFNQIKENQQVLNNKDNEKIILDFFRQSSITSIPIHDTGWLAKAPDANGITTIHKGDLIPETLTIDFNIDINIPELLLPYIEPIVLIKNPPDSILSVYPLYTKENWDESYFVVTGDATTLLKRNFSLLTALSTFTDQQFTNMGVPASHGKKAWRVDINDGADVGHIEDIVHEVVVGPVTTRFITAPATPPLTEPLHEISALSSTSFTAIGNETITGGGPPVTNLNVTRSLNFADATSYSITIRFGSTIQGSTITSQVFTFINNYLYYSSLRQRQLLTTNTANDMKITNFPDSGTGETLPYTTISVERNPVDFPQTGTEIITSLYTEAPVFGSTEIQKKYTLWRISEAIASNFPSYRLKLASGVTLLSPANIDDIDNPTVKTQSDLYPIVGSTYSRTTNDTGLKTNGTYITSGQDVQYKIMIVVKNPLAYQEVRKYDTEQ